MKPFKIILLTLLVAFLTVLTQVGGIVLILSIPFFRFIQKKSLKKTFKRLLNIGFFSVFYMLISFLVIPSIASKLGRVPMPVFSNEKIKPLNIMTCILNRHYVRQELKTSIENVSKELNSLYPNTTISYLDANFPLFNGFSLVPHLSHDDGKKLDIAFFYKDKYDNMLNHKAPSFIGYGVFEEPKGNEYNAPKDCSNKGFWQYSILEKIVPQWNKKNMIFDLNRTKLMIQFLLQENSTEKIFIEPHLKTRMNLQNNKIRFHGCRAVRHDDHIHLQIR